jgi:hypothetical protein
MRFLTFLTCQTGYPYNIYVLKKINVYFFCSITINAEMNPAVTEDDLPQTFRCFAG